MGSKVFKGVPAAPGLACGPVFIWQEPDLSLPAPYPCEDAQSAWQKIRTVIDRAKNEIADMRLKMEREIGKEEAGIFDAHLMMVEDVALHEMTQTALKNGINPEAAWHETIETFAGMLESIPDPILSARAADVRDIGNRVLAHLLGKSAAQIVLRKPSIVIARDLTPSQTALMDHDSVLAFCTAEGGATSHTAILAKSLGIPAIVALGETILHLPPGDFVLVDAIAGELTHQPTSEQRQIFEQRRTQAMSQQAEILKAAFEPAITRDNVRVEVFANIGSVADAHAAIAHGAEGVGLFRTEFLFLSRQSMPSVEQQIEVYRKVIDTLGGRPLVVRTLDIGGDKQVDYLGITSEPNPFLGWRGIRMISERADVLLDQLYALLTAAAGTDLRIMLPMVSQVGEVISARRLLDEALAAVRQADADFQIKLQLGIMIEVPSAALMVEHFAPHVDFFSIGTNDLTQYTLAVDRTNARVASLASPFHPAVLKLIERTVRVAHENRKWVGMCGEFAGEPLAVPFLLGVGLDEFSMPPPAIPTIKHIIRQISVEACKGIAEHVLRMATTEETRDYLKSELERLITESA